MQHAVLALPVADQQLLELAYFQGRSLSEVASALAIPLGTVKSRLRRLLLKLRRVMDVLQDREPR
jgi:RNA polymerase sigma-70 factor (ECF subfamily)